MGFHRLHWRSLTSLRQRVTSWMRTDYWRIEAGKDDPQPMTLRNIATAVGAYERTLVTPSPFDAYLAGIQEALPPTAKAHRPAQTVGRSASVTWLGGLHRHYVRMA